MAELAVIFGAGNIGRGFAGRLLALSGYDLCFVDVSETLVDALNAAGRYTVRLVDNSGTRPLQIGAGCAHSVEADRKGSDAAGDAESYGAGNAPSTEADHKASDDAGTAESFGAGCALSTEADRKASDDAGTSASVGASCALSTEAVQKVSEASGAEASSGAGCTHSVEAERKASDAFGAAASTGAGTIAGDSAEPNERVRVRAALPGSREAVEAFCGARIAFTAVGANALQGLAVTLADCVRARSASGKGPLDIVLCENQNSAAQLLRGWLDAALSPEEVGWCDANIGLVAATVGCMVPKTPDSLRKAEPLTLCAEPYARLQTDLAAYRAPVPYDIAGLEAFSPFEYYVRRKLFIHNCGHAVCAYMGWARGYAYIYEAIADPEIYAATRAAMRASAEALCRVYGEGLRTELDEHIADLLARFANKALGDTVARVAADPIRKLRRDDRLIGAALMCEANGVDTAPFVEAIARALKYDNPDDARAVELQNALARYGVEACLRDYCGLGEGETLLSRILDAYERLSAE